MRVSRYAVTRIADDNTQWMMTLNARLVFVSGREEEDRDRSGWTRRDSEDNGGLENGGWGGREQSEGAEREKSRRCVGDWAEAGWRLGGDIFGID